MPAGRLLAYEPQFRGPQIFRGFVLFLCAASRQAMTPDGVGMTEGGSGEPVLVEATHVCAAHVRSHREHNFVLVMPATAVTPTREPFR
jgi:hypothetical protein